MAQIRVAAAASLSVSLNQLKPAFETLYPQHTVEYIYQGSSGFLAGQINQQIIHPHVYMAASPYPMDTVQYGTPASPYPPRGLVAGSRFNYLGNRLVIIRNNYALPVSISSFSGVTYSSTAVHNVPVFIAQPDSPYYVPAGNYARYAFVEAGNWFSFVESYATMAGMFSVTQVLNTVASHPGPAIGVVYYSDAMSRVGDVHIIAEASPAINNLITYPVGIIAGHIPPEVAAAQAFTAYLQTQEGLQFFLNNHFTSRL